MPSSILVGHIMCGKTLKINIILVSNYRKHYRWYWQTHALQSLHIVVPLSPPWRPFAKPPPLTLSLSGCTCPLPSLPPLISKNVRKCWGFSVDGSSLYSWRVIVNQWGKLFGVNSLFVGVAIQFCKQICSDSFLFLSLSYQVFGCASIFQLSYHESRTDVVPFQSYIHYWTIDGAGRSQYQIFTLEIFKSLSENTFKHWRP